MSIMKSTIIAFAFAVVGLLAPSASASTIDFLGEGKVAVVSIHSPTLGDISAYSGELDWKWDGSTPAGYSALFYSYCVDANNWVTMAQNVVMGSMYDVTAGDKAAWLFDNYAPGIHATGSGIDAAALQVAIWTSLYNPGISFTTGPFKLYTTGAIASEAHDYLVALYSSDYASHEYTATWLDAPTGHGQDQMIPNPVPEPASLLLLGTGLVATVVRRRRSGRRKAIQD
jgi:hypothetical protein